MPLEIGGISVGSIGDSRLPVVDALNNKGVKVSNLSIPHLRAGRMTGNALAERIECAQLLNSGTPNMKDELYEKIAKTAIELRLHHSRYPQRYTSAGFMERVAQELGIPIFVMDRTLRAIRIEAIMSAQVGMPEGLLQGFQETVNKFLDINNTPYTVSKSPNLQALMRKRDEGFDFTPDSFYRLIYQNPSNRFTGSWVTQEVEWLSEFYGLRVKTNADFSPLDRAVLSAASQGEQSFVSAQLSERIGIGIDPWVTATHANALLGRLKAS